MSNVQTHYWWLLMIVPIATIIFYPYILDPIWKKYSSKYERLTDDRQSKIAIKTLRFIYFFIAFVGGINILYFNWYKYISFEYFEIGLLQAIAGFYAFFTGVDGFGFLPGHLLYLDRHF
eukprot:4275_1